MPPLAHYLYNGPEFVMFDWIHIISILLSVAGCIVLPKKILSMKKKNVDRIIKSLSFIVMINIFIWMLL